ncbi:antibiotic biosynthesis monooxygenase family protein [Leptospira terpstrae]|uniref:antibiotic biosynthesis monooxygenase family protein n=1 Tax=Leptospira terpstrae TaxID=293075 RepID=UPI003D01535B
MLDSLKDQGQDLLTLESLPKSTAIEIAIVECASEDSEKYHKMRKVMLPLLQKEKGFLAWRAFQSKTREGIMLDLLYWENVEDCRKAGENIQSTEIGKEFFALMKQTLVFEMFERQSL